LAAEFYGIPKSLLTQVSLKFDGLIKGYVDQFHQTYPYRLENK
jgi:hypothetical protein